MRNKLDTSEKKPWYDDEHLYPAAHKTEVTLCYVTQNRYGDRMYGIHLEDREGLDFPILFEMRVDPEGYASLVFLDNFDGSEGKPAEHSTDIKLCYVSGDVFDHRVYGIYLEDEKGLRHPIGIEIGTNPDGEVDIVASEDDALESLWFLMPEYVEALEEQESEQDGEKLKERKENGLIRKKFK